MERDKKEKLAKLLALTTSDNDNEALSAIRTANVILERDNLAWEDVLLGTTKRTQFNDSYADYESTEEIEEMLSTCIQNVNGSAFDFIDSLYRFYNSRGYLTPKQIRSLRKFYDNCH